MKRLLRVMQDHDANEEIRYLREGRVCIGWSWLWLDWTFGIAVYADPDDRWMREGRDAGARQREEQDR